MRNYIYDLYVAPGRSPGPDMKESFLTYYQLPPAQAQHHPKNGFGITALVLGIIALILGFIPFVSLFTSIPLGLLGIIFGIIGLVRVSKRVATNKVMTIFGLVASALAVLLALTSSIATGAFIGSLGNDDSSPTPVTTQGTVELQEEEKLDTFPGQTEDDVVGKAGEELNIRGVQITASEVSHKNDTFGDRLCSKVTIQNDGDSEVSYNVFDWKLQYPSGDIKDPTISSGDSLNHGEIAPGGTAEGEVCFEDAGEEGQYILISEGLFSFSSERGAWITER